MGPEREYCEALAEAIKARIGGMLGRRNPMSSAHRVFRVAEPWILEPETLNPKLGLIGATEAESASSGSCIEFQGDVR